MGGRTSPGSSSDSDTADTRDVTAQNLSRIDLRETSDGQSAQWVATTAPRNTVTHDPSFPYSQSGQPGLTTHGTLQHEVGGHEQADRVYQHPDDPDLRGVNMHLPGQSADDPECVASYQRQFATIQENWDVVTTALDQDWAVNQDPAWRDHVNSRIQYAQATAHVHNESTAIDLTDSLRGAGLADGPLGNQLRAITSEARRRQMLGGEVERIPLVTATSSTRMAAYTHTLGGAQGWQQPKPKGRK
ncbi:hypothetical protein ACGFIK_13425 [Micromonospora sp. NPDC048871]|uniref:hypothetical protein n=1 Tax=Micromonospora sp. NPDC048871 TaxID=3364259 RepID=UPI00371CECCC